MVVSVFTPTIAIPIEILKLEFRFTRSTSVDTPIRKKTYLTFTYQSVSIRDVSERTEYELTK